jgi:hypothetical protein
MKGTHGFEADSRRGIDNARSLLKGNGCTLGNLECQTETEREVQRETSQGEANSRAMTSLY